MHSILPHYDLFNPELKYERTDAIKDTLKRLNVGFVEFVEDDFVAAVILPLPELALHLDCDRTEALNFRRKAVKEIDKTRRLAFTPEKIRTIKNTCETVVVCMQSEIESFGEPPYTVTQRLELTRLKSKINAAKDLILNCNKLLSKA